MSSRAGRMMITAIYTSRHQTPFNLILEFLAQAGAGIFNLYWDWVGEKHRVLGERRVNVITNFGAHPKERGRERVWGQVESMNTDQSPGSASPISVCP